MGVFFIPKLTTIPLHISDCLFSTKFQMHNCFYHLGRGLFCKLLALVVSYRISSGLNLLNFVQFERKVDKDLPPPLNTLSIRSLYTKLIFKYTWNIGELVKKSWILNKI